MTQQDETNPVAEFEKWFSDNTRRFHCGNYNEEDIARAAYYAGQAAMKDTCVKRLEAASAEYLTNAESGEFLTEEGRRKMIDGSEWADTMADAIRAL